MSDWTQRAIRIVICLALMHWAGMPFWAASILFVGLEALAVLNALVMLIITVMVEQAQEQEDAAGEIGRLYLPNGDGEDQ